jgi:CubicO group peptidase (beta-lactamase class C family)/predicted dienelactone hydrolase
MHYSIKQRYVCHLVNDDRKEMPDMLRINQVCIVFVIAALILSACQPITPPERLQSPEPQGLRPDAPEYAKHGLYWVGYKPIIMGEGNARPLMAGLWYPALNPDGAREEVTYDNKLKGTEDPDTPVPVYGHALPDAAADAAGAPYPLVVFSHGFGAGAAWYNTIIEHLTSNGFIILAPDHIEQFDWEFSDSWKASIDRPRDIKQTLDFAEQLTAPSGDLAGLIDMENVAVVGHSLGGYTALAMAGAQYDLDAYNARCAELPPNDPNMFLCTPLVPKEADMAARAGLDPMPEGLWPSFGDPRVKAIIPIAGDSYLFDKAGLSKITIPMMAIGGTADTGTPYEWGSKPSYEYASSAKKVLVTLDGAEHAITTSCENMPWIREAPYYVWVCFDPVWDKDRGQDLINYFATAFLLAELKGDADAAAALAPENVAFPGIEYMATGYDSAAEPAADLDKTTVAKIDTIVEQVMADKQVPGAAVGVVKDGELVYAKGFGVTELGSDQLVTPDSVFFMASIAKSVTGMAIMQLVEDGKIDLDAPVTDYLPYFTLADPAAQEITIRQLLSHASGMADYGDWMADVVDENQSTDDGALEEYVRSFGDGTLLFPPDEGWSYSNSGFDTLGDVIAKVSGQSFEAYVQEHILTPLGMKDSTFLLSDVNPVALVAPHTWEKDGQAVVQNFYPYLRKHGPSATLFSSVNDMARFAAANMNHGELEDARVLPDAAYVDMWSPQVASTWAEMFGPQVTDYGLGWWVGTTNGQSIIGNYGAEAGFQSHLGIFPDKGFAVIAMVNAYDPEAGAFPAYDIGNGVAEVLLGMEPEGETPTEPASTLDADTVTAIDAMIEETMARINLPGFALAVVKDGEVAYAKGYGVTSLDGGEPVTSQTVFQWAENSMALTAMAVLQLVEEGKIDLNAPVIDYVPYFKLADERYKEITVGQILAHTSGIPDSGDRMADWENFMPEYDGGALERWVRNDLAQKGLLFAPGEGWEYSDLAYALLGAVIGAASGQPYEEYMQEHILAPLGMDKSTFLLEEVDKALLASPHVPDAAGEVVVSEAMPYHRPFAATNNLFGSVEDMAKLAQANLNRGALGDQSILPESAYDVMWTATSPTSVAEYPFGQVHPSYVMLDWGNGWFLGDIAGHPAPHSYGGENGFNADMVLVPDANLAVVAVGNSQAMDEYYSPDIAVDVAAMLLEEIEPQ